MLLSTTQFKQIKYLSLNTNKDEEEISIQYCLHLEAKSLWIWEYVPTEIEYSTWKLIFHWLISGLDFKANKVIEKVVQVALVYLKIQYVRPLDENYYSLFFTVCQCSKIISFKLPYISYKFILWALIIHSRCDLLCNNVAK